MLGGGVANYIAFGWSEPFLLISVLRILAFAMSLACFFSTCLASDRRPVDHWILLYFVILVIGETVEMLFTPFQSLRELPTLLIIVLAYYMFYPTRLYYMVFGGLLAELSYCAAVGVAYGVTPLFTNSIIAFSLVNAFGIYYVRGMNRMQRTKFLALKNEKELNARLQREIAVREKAQQMLFEQATVDALTGAYNRRFFLELAEKEFSRSKRHQQPLALIMIDLDHFKAVNDSHGHDMGDFVLSAMAATFRKDLREEDLIGRLGGEEFAVLLPNTEMSEAMNVAGRIRQRVEGQPVVRGGTIVRITVSLGVRAMIPGPDSDLSQWLKSTDTALYSAKHNGRNQVFVAK
jgi:diguanylate cyclase (GGDEF)-like protein